MAAKTPWVCVECGVTNPDVHIQKCLDCKIVRKVDAPEKLDEEAARNEAELKHLKASVKESAKWSDCGSSSRGVEESQKKRIAELREKMKKTKSPDNKVVKSIMRDKSREENNYDGRRKQ